MSNLRHSVPLHYIRNTPARLGGIPRVPPRARIESGKRLRIVYVLMYFPYLTETFIADEIHALRELGHDVRIVSLLTPPRSIVQAKSDALMPIATFAPKWRSLALWRAQWRVVQAKPRVYVRLLVDIMTQRVVAQPVRTLFTRLAVFLKAVWIADEWRDTPPDVLHSHFAWLSGAAAGVAAALVQRPFSVTAHAYDVFSPKRDMLALIGRTAARVVAISEFNRNHVVEHTHCDSARVALVHCGVDGAAIPRHTRAWLRRTSVPSAPDAPIGEGSDRAVRLLSVGRLVEKKGHHVLLDACRLLVDAGVDVRCTIIGDGPDEGLLRARIRALGIGDRVELRGAVQHAGVCAALTQHDIFVLACVVARDGNQDGIPVALMEAAHAGMPLVSTRVSGVPELVRHMETGWLVQPGCATSLAQAVLALQGNPSLMQRLGTNARAHARANFSIRESARQLAKVFTEIAQRDTSDISRAPHPAPTPTRHAEVAAAQS